MLMDQTYVFLRVFYKVYQNSVQLVGYFKVKLF